MNANRYKVGDIVVVRHDLKSERYFDENGHTCWAANEMLKFAGHMMVISYVYKSISGANRYKLIGGDGWVWVAGMFEDGYIEDDDTNLEADEEALDCYLKSFI